MPKPEIEFRDIDVGWEWQPIEGDDLGIKEKILSRDEATGDYTRLLKFPPGIETTQTLEHEFWEEVLLVEGSLHDIAKDEHGTARLAIRLHGGQDLFDFFFADMGGVFPTGQQMGAEDRYLFGCRLEQDAPAMPREDVFRPCLVIDQRAIPGFENLKLCQYRAGDALGPSFTFPAAGEIGVVHVHLLGDAGDQFLGCRFLK